MKKEFLLFALVAVLFITIGALFGWKKLQDMPAPAGSANQLLGLSLPDPQGKPQILSQWKGKTLVVNFWATWCPPCVEEMPDLVQLHKQAAPHNIQVIGIGVDSADKIQEFSTKYKISYPLLVAGMEGSELSRQLVNSKGGLPFTVIIGADGKIKKTYLGRLDMPALRKELAVF